MPAVNYLCTRGQLKLILNSCKKPVDVTGLSPCLGASEPARRHAARAAADGVGNRGLGKPGGALGDCCPQVAKQEPPVGHFVIWQLVILEFRPIRRVDELAVEVAGMVSEHLAGCSAAI